MSSVTIPTHPTLMCVGTAREAQIISGVINTNELDDARQKLNERYQSSAVCPIISLPHKKQKNGDDRER